MFQGTGLPHADGCLYTSAWGHWWMWKPLGLALQEIGLQSSTSFEHSTLDHVVPSYPVRRKVGKQKSLHDAVCDLDGVMEGRIRCMWIAWDNWHRGLLGVDIRWGHEPRVTGVGKTLPVYMLFLITSCHVTLYVGLQRMRDVLCMCLWENRRLQFPYDPLWRQRSNGANSPLTTKCN